MTAVVEHVPTLRPPRERSLVIGGDGYVGRTLVDALRAIGRGVTIGSRRPQSDSTAGRVGVVETADAAAFDRAADVWGEGTVVCLPQLQCDDMDWILDRIDGPRWLVFSSAQLGAAHRAPGHDVALVRERLAIVRGAVVVRPTMIFGRGGDRNITRVARTMARLRVPVQVGDGTQLVQPIHVDDVVAFVEAHAASADPVGGLYELGGGEAVPVAELNQMIGEMLGLTGPPMPLPLGPLKALGVGARVLGLRPDQLDRLIEDKTVDTAAARRDYGWRPAPLTHRLEQALHEAGLT